MQDAIRSGPEAEGRKGQFEGLATASACSKQACHAPSQVRVCLQAWLPARTYVREALETRQEVDGSREIIKLSRYCPWKEHLYELEQELSIEPLIKFCLYEVRASLSHVP